MTARLIMKLRVDAVRPCGQDVSLFTLVHARRPELPAFSPGAHVDLHLPDGRIRQYSLCGDPAERRSYRIAIRREGQGRGGSVLAHETLRPGAIVPVSAPRNNFSLADGARRHILVAGGIGITPFAAMAHQLRREGAEFTLHYCTRRRDAPLMAELRALCGPHLVRHCADDPADARFDPAMLGAPNPDTHVYCCGPARLLRSVQAATAAWPAAQVHWEVFQAAVDETFRPEPFDVILASTGERVRVPADRSALEVLRLRGLVLPSSCESGVCGACECGYRSGAVIHRDSLLDATARQARMMLCVSRGRGSVTLEL
jgi:ferredoxin-NADP reductase